MTVMEGGMGDLLAKLCAIDDVDVLIQRGVKADGLQTVGTAYVGDGAAGGMETAKGGPHVA